MKKKRDNVRFAVHTQRYSFVRGGRETTVPYTYTREGTCAQLEREMNGWENTYKETTAHVSASLSQTRFWLRRRRPQNRGGRPPPPGGGREGGSEEK